MTRTTVCNFRAEALSGPLAAREVLTEAMAALSTWQVEKERRGVVQIVLAEVLNNVVEHAYELRPGHDFAVEMCRSGGSLRCTVTDHGVAFPDLCLPEGQPAVVDVPVESLPEGGFGWHMIRELSESISYERLDDTNILVIEFRIS